MWCIHANNDNIDIFKEKLDSEGITYKIKECKPYNSTFGLNGNYISVRIYGQDNNQKLHKGLRAI